DKLADVIGMSARSFTRHFTNTVGETPAKFVEYARLENARLLIEEDKAISLQEAATASGFSSTEHLTRAFERRFGIHPNQYRTSFNLT
ncbi:MAG: helix-turn-helix domain-containing protein, partial [Kordiimonas sp.]